MDRHLKERMVGAVVLVATAVILIPEMLSGPRVPQQPSGASAITKSMPSSVKDTSETIGNSALKTYTIDLSKSAPASTSTGESVLAVAPIPSVPSANTDAGTTSAPPSEEVPVSTDLSPNQQSAAAAAPERSVREAESAIASRSSSPHAEQPRGTASPVVTGAWAVQVGSFGVRATSERIAADLRRDGFSSFVVAFRSNNQTMYRVRVGPERDRAAAEVLLSKLKIRHPNATLVPPT